MPLDLPLTTFCPLAVPSALPCPLPSPLSYPVPCRSFCAAVLTAARTNRSVSPFPSLPCPALCSTLPLLCNHLDFYLPSALPSTHLCPCPVPILTPDLRPPSVASSNMSLLCHLCPLLLPSRSRYPSHSSLSLSCPPLRLTHASPSPGLSCPLSCAAQYAALRPARRDLMTPLSLLLGFCWSINHVLSWFRPSLPSVSFSPLFFCLRCSDP